MCFARRKSIERCEWRWKVTKSKWNGFKACENNFLNICFRFVECIWYMAYLMIVIWYIWFVFFFLYLIHLNFSNYKTFSLHFMDICFGYLLLIYCYNYLIILLCLYFITIVFFIIDILMEDPSHHSNSSSSSSSMKMKIQS